MHKQIPIYVDSEIGKLKGVILHTPGMEVENMTPQNAERALYSDILNLSVASKEYEQLKDVLTKVTQTFEIKDLLKDILKNNKISTNLINRVCANEKVNNIKDELKLLSPELLTKALIEGVEMKKDNLTNYLNKEPYLIRPLHNFFFTRDASVTINNKVLISRMANKVREREAMIMELIFDYHPAFTTKTINPFHSPNFSDNLTIEGGDILIAGKNTLLIGLGPRTSSQGIDFIIEHLKKQKTKQHLIIQELPHTPESFIHLDMVFTFLDYDYCMIYEPLILKSNRYQTIHIEIDNGKVKINDAKNIIDVFKTLGRELKPISCGGKKDASMQEREQWHSGANFFTIEPGKVIGYGRNVHTTEEMNNHGFEIIKATDIISGKDSIKKHKKCVLTIEGAELARGGGGCRCMTMPVSREPISI